MEENGERQQYDVSPSGMQTAVVAPRDTVDAPRGTVDAPRETVDAPHDTSVTPHDTTIPGIPRSQYMPTEFSNPSYPLGEAKINQPQPSVGLNDYSGSPQTVVVTQPQVKPPNQDFPLYIQCAVWSAVWCFVPLGIIASVFACLAYRRDKAGDKDGKHRFVRVSKYLTITSCLLGLVGYIIIIIVYAKYL